MSFHCDVIVIEDDPTVGAFNVQFQFRTFTLTLTASDLAFARRIVDFVSETKGNPAYRDQHLGGGVYKTMPEKCIDLSSSFPGVSFEFQKNGEFDDAYVAHVACSSGMRLHVEIRGDELESFVEGLRSPS